MLPLVRTRCTRCGRRFAHQGLALDVVRLKRCPDCGTRTTVVDVEQHAALAPGPTIPAAERCVITARTTEIARRLVALALD